MKQFLVVIAILAIIAGGFWIARRPAQTPSTTQSLATNTPTSPAMSSYTLAQVMQHRDKTSCWMAIEGQVYDVTPFIAGAFHPGGDMILLGCGKDATSLFNARPGSGSTHSSRARAMLPRYLIGTLVQ